MKLVLENEFIWDGIYEIPDDRGNSVFTVDARIEEDGNLFLISCMGEDEFGRVERKKTRRIEMYAGKAHLGTVRRDRDDYEIEFRDWMVSGDVNKWAFRVVDRHGDIAASEVTDGHLAFDVFDDRNLNAGVILMIGLAAAVSTEKSGSDVHDFIDKVEDVADTVAKFGHETFTKIEKLYGVYDAEEDARRKEAPKKEGLDLHEVADKVEDFADKTAEAGHKAMDFIEKLYGLNEPQEHDTGRDQ